MIPKSILYGGMGVVGLGVLGIWVLSDDGEEDGLGELERAQGRGSGGRYELEQRERRVTGRSRGTGLGRRKMDRNEIIEVGRRLRWELNPLRRRAALGQLLEGMNEENAMLAREQIVHFSEESPEFQDFHFAWGAMLGVDAVNMGADTEEKDMAATMTGWASVDPVGALAWYDSLEEDRRNCRDVTIGMLKGLASSDLVFATDFAVDKLEAKDKHAGEMLKVVKDKMLELETLPTAAEWAVALPEGEVRNEMLMGVAGEFAEREPKEAAKWAETLDGDEGARIKLVVAGQWAQEDPVASLEWARDLQDGEARRSAMIRAGRALMKQNAEEGRQWLEESGLTEDIRREIVK